MANNGPNTNKSQFFITYAKQPHLDLKYTVFGKVIDGFDALDELETIKVDAKYRPVVEQSKACYSTQTNEELKAQQAKIKQSQDYFSQYIEEYYEEDEDEDSEPVLPEKVEEEIHLETIDEVVSLLKKERVRDIVVLFLGEDGPGIVDTMVICSPFNARHGIAVSEILRKAGKSTDEQVICSPFNARHGIAVSEILRKAGKSTDEQPKKCTVRHSFGWFQIELGRIQVHVMGEEVRQRFDLESFVGLE
ncbi:hypothetical protein COOONC_12338 [Cooperia oncophora]